MDIPGPEALSPREEQQLVSSFLVGDEEAVREVYQRFGRPVYTLGLRLLGSTNQPSKPRTYRRATGRRVPSEKRLRSLGWG